MAFAGTVSRYKPLASAETDTAAVLPETPGLPIVACVPVRRSTREMPPAAPTIASLNVSRIVRLAMSYLAVTTLGAHPFSTGGDQCLVHNGSLSNHNNLRRELVREGMAFETENDTEVAAAYLTSEMAKGKDLGEALTGALDDLDGFFTFVVGTKSGFGVVRDAIACKPAVMAETDRYVAFGSEYRALVSLPGIEAARVWEPEPATVYFWER